MHTPPSLLNFLENAHSLNWPGAGVVAVGERVERQAQAALIHLRTAAVMWYHRCHPEAWGLYPCRWETRREPRCAGAGL